MISLVGVRKGEALSESKRKTGQGREAEVRVKGWLKEDGILVSSKDGVEELSLRGYGVSRDGNLMLAFHEALFLLSKDVVEVVGEKTGEAVGFQALLERFQSLDEDAWVKYLIYRDLRSRGYVVREGFGLGIDFRVYDRGEYGKETAKYLTLGILEGKPLSLGELTQVLRHAQSLKKKLVLAVVNRRGEVVYYSLSRLTLK